MLSKINKIIIFSALLSGFFILPYCANAQALSLISNKSACLVGDEISIVLSLNTSDKLINVVAGTVNFPKEFFDIKSIESGNSFLKLWPAKPDLSKSQDGTIIFAGGVPHGFKGPSGNVFSFILKAKKAGEPVISTSNATFFLNDGLGTKLNGVTLVPLKIEIDSSKKK